MINDNKRKKEIHLNIRSLDEILINLNTPHYRKRCLNEDIEDYIVEQASSFQKRDIIDLKISIPGNSCELRDIIEKSIRNHFIHLKEKSLIQYKHSLKFGWRSLLIAFLFLGIIISITELEVKFFPENGLTTLIRESLIILGWVAFWRPAELLLYEWYPFKRDARLYDRISKSNIHVVSSDSEGIQNPQQ
ncbi:MAG: hypothetical protein JXA06_04895 [Bacteroidetes bacterium]|nr:hypothetical protein [Bacteroidota bacterium]